MSQNYPGLVSIIVPARNEEANLECLVRSLAAQRGVREILIVDDQSEDRTLEILEAMKAGHRFSAYCTSTRCRKAGWARRTL